MAATALLIIHGLVAVALLGAMWVFELHRFSLL